MPASKAVHEDGSSDVTLPNDLILGSDSSVLKFGADSDTTLTTYRRNRSNLKQHKQITFQRFSFRY